MFKKNLSIILCGVFIGCMSVFSGYLIDNNLLKSIVYISFFINFSFLYFYNKFNHISSFFSDTVILLVVAFTAYFVTYPLDFINGYNSKYTDIQVTSTAFLYLLGNLALLIGILLGNRMGLKAQRTLTEDLKKEYNFSVASVIVLLIGIVLMIYDQYRLGGVSVLGISNRMNNFAAQRATQGSSLSLPWHNFIEAGLIGLALSVKKRKHIYIVLSFMFFIALFFFMGLGSRTMILLTCLPAFAIFIDKGYIKINKIQNVFIIMLIIFLFSPFFTNFRNYLISDMSLNNLPKEAWAWSNGETGTSFQISVDVISIKSWTDADPSYITSFLYTLPSSIYQVLVGESKPLNLGDWYVKYFYPYIFESGGGFGFSPIAQAWMNGGLISIIVVFSIIGFLISYINKTSYYKYLMLALVIWFQRGAFNSVVTEFIYTAVLLVCITLLSKILNKRSLEKK